MFSGAYRASRAWAPLPGFEDRYEVSDEGHIRSLGGEHIRSCYCDGDGYLRVCVWTDRGPRSISVHRAVATAFHGDKQNALHREVAHLDGNRANPRADNLKWVSKVENRSHRKLHGTECHGANHGGAKLTDEAVAEIRSYPKGAVDLKALGRKFGVSWRTVGSLRCGKGWKHVSGVSVTAREAI